jgi:hypothetical protein
MIVELKRAQLQPCTQHDAHVIFQAVRSVEGAYRIAKALAQSHFRTH